MEESERQAEQYKICDSIEDPDCCITNSQDGFHIEQTNEGTLKIVRIPEQNTNTNDEYSVERARTPKTTTVGKKRIRDELSREIKRTRDRGTQSWEASAKTFAQPPHQPTETFPENADGARSKQVRKKRREKHITLHVIQKHLMEQMDDLKSRMCVLERENKDLQQLAFNLRDTLQGVIQQQKLTRERMVSCGTQVNVAMENNLMVSQGTQVSMRVILKPVLTNYKTGVIPRVLDIPLLRQDGSASQLVYVPSNRDVSDSRPNDELLRQRFTVKNLEQDKQTGRAFGPIPLSLPESETVLKNDESVISNDIQVQKDERCIPNSKDLIAKEVCAKALRPAVAENTKAPPISNVSVKRTIPLTSMMPSVAHLTTGLVSDSRLASNWGQISYNNTAIEIPSTSTSKETELSTHNRREFTSPTSFMQGGLEQSGFVHCASSNYKAMATKPFQGSTNSLNEPPNAREVSYSFQSNQESGHPKIPSQLQSFQSSGFREQRLSQESRLINTSSGRLSHGESDLQHESERLQTQPPITMPIHASHKEDRFQKQLSPPQKSQLMDKSNCSNTTFTDSPSQYIQATPKVKDISSSRMLSLEIGGLEKPNTNAQRRSQLSNESFTDASLRDCGFQRPGTRKQLNLTNSNPNLHYVWDNSQCKTDKAEELPVALSNRLCQEDNIFTQGSPTQLPVSKLTYPLINRLSSISSGQKRGLQNEKSRVQSTSQDCSTGSRPKAKLISPPVQPERKAPLETAGLVRSLKLTKHHEPVQTIVSSIKMCSNTLVEKIDVKSPKQNLQCNESFPKSLPFRRPPVGVAQAITTPTNSDAVLPINVGHSRPFSTLESSDTHYPCLSNQNINFVRPNLLRPGTSQDIRQDAKNADRQPSQQLKFSNYPASSSSSFKPFPVSLGNEIQGADRTFTQAENLNNRSLSLFEPFTYFRGNEIQGADRTFTQGENLIDGSFQVNEDSFQAMQLETPPWNYLIEENSFEDDSDLSTYVKKMCHENDILSSFSN